MLKRLVILAVVLASFGSLPPIPRQTAYGNDSSSHNPEEQANSGQNPSTPTLTIVEKNCESDQFKNDADCKAAKEKESTIAVSKLPTANVTIQRTPGRDKFDWLAYWANVAVLIVASVTLWWFIVQTNATKKAADAALLNVKALIISERPWFVVDIKSQIENGRLMHVLSFANRGRTPAELIEVHCACELHPTNGFTPTEALDCPLIHPTQTLFFTDDPVRIYEVHPDGMLSQDNRNGNDPRTVYVFGRIRYWDKFTDRTLPGVESYLTQWCFHYIPGTGDSLDRFALTPNGYNKHT